MRAFWSSCASFDVALACSVFLSFFLSFCFAFAATCFLVLPLPARRREQDDPRASLWVTIKAKESAESEGRREQIVDRFVRRWPFVVGEKESEKDFSRLSLDLDSERKRKKKRNPSARPHPTLSVESKSSSVQLSLSCSFSERGQGQKRKGGGEVEEEEPAAAAEKKKLFFAAAELPLFPILFSPPLSSLFSRLSPLSLRSK